MNTCGTSFCLMGRCLCDRHSYVVALTHPKHCALSCLNPKALNKTLKPKRHRHWQVIFLYSIIMPWIWPTAIVKLLDAVRSRFSTTIVTKMPPTPGTQQLKSARHETLHSLCQRYLGLDSPQNPLRATGSITTIQAKVLSRSPKWGFRLCKPQNAEATSQKNTDSCSPKPKHSDNCIETLIET